MVNTNTGALGRTRLLCDMHGSTQKLCRGMERKALLVVIAVVFLAMAGFCYCPFELGTIRAHSAATILAIIDNIRGTINGIDTNAEYALGQTATGYVMVEGILFTTRLWIYDQGYQFCTATPSPRHISGERLRVALLGLLQSFQGDMIRFAASHFLAMSGEYAIQYFNDAESPPPPEVENDNTLTQLPQDNHTLMLDPSSCWIFKSTIVGGPEAVQHSTLYAREIIYSSKYYLTMQADCNLVIYRGTDPTWASGTDVKASGCRLRLQADGNLVIYSSSNQVVWASNVYCEPQPSCQISTIFTIEDDGNGVVYDTDRQMGLWATNIVHL